MNKRLYELALIGLEAEKDRLEREIADLRAEMSGSLKSNEGTAVAVGRAVSSVRVRRARPPLSEEGRKRLSDAAKRRWIKSKKAGRTTL